MFGSFFRPSPGRGILYPASGGESSRLQVRREAMLKTVAAVELLVCWFAWGYPFIVRAPHGQQRKSTIDPASTWTGFGLQVAAVFLAWACRLPAGEPPGLARVVGSMLLGPLAAILAWAAVRHLGRQYRITAGVWEDHELVRTGAYGLVRHPIYTSILLLLLSTLLLLTPWHWFAVSLALYIVGVEIRIHGEERLLARRFGEEFQRYRRDVWAYVPFLR